MKGSPKPRPSQQDDDPEYAEGGDTITPLSHTKEHQEPEPARKNTEDMNMRDLVKMTYAPEDLAGDPTVALHPGKMIKSAKTKAQVEANEAWRLGSQNTEEDEGLTPTDMGRVGGLVGWRDTATLLQSVHDFLPEHKKLMQPLLSLEPHQVYAIIHEAIKDTKTALVQGQHESAAQAATRKQAQASYASALVLPRAPLESDQNFKQRVHVFRPDPNKRSLRGKPPAVLVVPQAKGERDADFEKRLAVQATTALPVLPRGPHESPAHFDKRCTALRSANLKWGKRPADGMPPPLVLPRGESETDATLSKRLDVATLPAACRVVLPQGEREDDAHAVQRLTAQSTQLHACMLPFDSARESDEQFAQRLAKKVRTPGRSPGSRGISGKLASIRSSMKRTSHGMSSRLTFMSTRLSSAKHGISRKLGISRKVREPVPSTAADAGVWRPPEPEKLDQTALLYEQKSGCGCCF